MVTGRGRERSSRRKMKGIKAVKRGTMPRQRDREKQQKECKINK